MKHYCPMCGEQWNDDVCEVCGWREGKQTRYTGRIYKPRTPRKGKTQAAQPRPSTTRKGPT